MSLTAARLQLIGESASSVAAQKARDLKAQGVDIISLASGEPDFPTPPHVIDAAIAAMRAGDTGYTPVPGTPALRAAISRKFKRENDLDYAIDEIIVSPGAKAVISAAMTASINPGDEVIVPTPAWVSYTDMTKLAGGKPVEVECKRQFGLKLDPETLEAAITPKTRWLVLNSPVNPSGIVYSAEEFKALGEVLKRHPHVMVMSDEIYEHLLFDGTPFACFAQCCPELKGRTLTINGVSKAYAMTGWRIGYAGGPKELIKAMGKVQSQTVGSNSSISQAASVAALDGPQDFIKERAAEYQARRDRCMALLDAIPGLKCMKPLGAFYLYVDCSGVIGAQTPEGATIATDSDLVNYLLDTAHVALVTGSAYGMSPWFRVSIASALPVLESACTRIAAAMTTLVPAKEHA